MIDTYFKRSPKIIEIAEKSGLSPATVDRVLNGRPGTSEKARNLVAYAIKQLGFSVNSFAPLPFEKLAVISEAGTSFSELLVTEIDKLQADFMECEITLDSVISSQFEPEHFSEIISTRASTCDAIILISRDDIKVNAAVKNAVSLGKSVICLTTDLPNSQRTAYVGIENISSGSTAAWMMGRMLPPDPGNVLILSSANYRSQEEREMGFRRVIRKDFPHLNISERIHISDESEGSYQSVKNYLAKCSPLSGIYNTAGGNRGIALALSESSMKQRPIFIGHELTTHTRSLLNNNAMDIVLSHDLRYELETCLKILREKLSGYPYQDAKTVLHVINKYSHS